jgi:hypothetical protein
MGDNAGIQAEPETKYPSHSVSTTKDNNQIDVEEFGEKNSPNDSSVNSREQEQPEPPTTRLELWAWYAYYFGNNSAGTLSYAPLSESFFVTFV